MPPKSKAKGGRPKTAWNSSRRRKLVRLYTLTSLDKDEIQRVLRDDDFNPSASDIQKKLRSLLPKDYAKNYRGMRPSSDANMKIRLSHISRRKRRRSRSKSTSPETDGRYKPQTKCSLELNLARPNLQTSLQSESKETFDEWHFQTPLGNPFVISPRPVAPGFPTINPSLLYQCKSATEGYSSTDMLLPPGACHGSAMSSDEQIPTMDPEKRWSPSSPVVSKHSASFKDYGIPKKSTSWHLKRPSLGSLKAPSFFSFRPRSVRSLMKRLTNVYPSSYVDHIHSVLSLSSGSGSWGSSIISAGSSIISASGVINGENPASFLDARNSRLSRDEEIVWNELVNESSVVETHKSRPKYLSASLNNRPCCHLQVDGIKHKSFSVFEQPNDMLCSNCGFLKAHYITRNYETTNGDNTLLLKQLLQGALNVEDNYGNTPLHFMAASETVNIESLVSLVLAGANVHTRNSSGETFLHVIRRRDVSMSRREPSEHTMNVYRSLIDVVKLQQYNLQQKDFHGRTLCHVFLDLYPRSHDHQFICNLLEILRPDINSYDNLGNNLKDMCIRRMMFQNSWSALQRFKYMEYCDPATAEFVFRESIASQKLAVEILHKNWKYKKLFTWVDGRGDSYLAAIIKYWRADIDELALAGLISELLDAGVGVHMRDRDGNTPLANAVRLGSRPAVSVLLKANSNIHTRNYKGHGILAIAKACLVQAQKEENDNRYAKILSCINALVDAGAKADPTERDELFTPTARARGSNQSWAIFQRDDTVIPLGR